MDELKKLSDQQLRAEILKKEAAIAAFDNELRLLYRFQNISGYYYSIEQTSREIKRATAELQALRTERERRFIP